MKPEEYHRFTERLRAGLEGNPEVLGLVALGSMSGEGVPPDTFSDHDFVVVVRPGAQERFRQDLGWLPDAAQVALSFRETAHGLKVVYLTGHLLEFAVFDPDELYLARVNRYRVLLDRADIGVRMRAVRAATAAAGRPDDAYLVGQLLTSLLVGVGRWRRGEQLSGEHLVRCEALGLLLRLLAFHVPAADPGAPDGLDPLRRFERAWPSLAAELKETLARDVPAAAQGILALASRELAGRVALPVEGFAAVARAIAG